MEFPPPQIQTRWVKVIILALISVLGAGLAWQLLAVGFTRSQSLLFWIYPGLAASSGVVFLAFLSIVNRNKLLYLGTVSAMFFWYLLVMPKDLFVVIGGALFVLLALLFDSRIKHDENSRADFSMSRVMRDCVHVMVYALLLIVGFNIYANSSGELKNNPKQFYDQIGHYAARGLMYVPSGLGDFNPNQRFDDFVVKQAQRQDSSFLQSPVALQDQVLAGIKNQLLDQFHIQVSGNPLLGEVVAGAVSEKVESSAQSYQRFFPAIFAVIAIALLWALSFLFVWLVIFLSWIIFKLLLLVKFFRIEKVQVEVNKLQV